MATATDLLNFNSAKKRAGRLIESGARRVRTRSFWLEKFPFLGFLAGGYDLDKLAGDCIAGLTTALTVIPQGIGYAPLAGLPLQVRRRRALLLLVKIMMDCRAEFPRTSKRFHVTFPEAFRGQGSSFCRGDFNAAPLFRCPAHLTSS